MSKKTNENLGRYNIQQQREERMWDITQLGRETRGGKISLVSNRSSLETQQSCWNKWADARRPLWFGEERLTGTRSQGNTEVQYGPVSRTRGKHSIAQERWVMADTHWSFWPRVPNFSSDIWKLGTIFMVVISGTASCFVQCILIPPKIKWDEAENHDIPKKKYLFSSLKSPSLDTHGRHKGFTAGIWLWIDLRKSISRHSSSM